MKVPGDGCRVPLKSHWATPGEGREYIIAGALPIMNGVTLLWELGRSV